MNDWKDEDYVCDALTVQVLEWMDEKKGKSLSACDFGDKRKGKLITCDVLFYDLISLIATLVCCYTCPLCCVWVAYLSFGLENLEESFGIRQVFCSSLWRRSELTSLEALTLFWGFLNAKITNLLTERFVCLLKDHSFPILSMNDLKITPSRHHFFIKGRAVTIGPGLYIFSKKKIQCGTHLSWHLEDDSLGNDSIDKRTVGSKSSLRAGLNVASIKPTITTVPSTDHHLNDTLRVEVILRSILFSVFQCFSFPKMTAKMA